jgi:hypothetical protein
MRVLGGFLVTGHYLEPVEVLKTMWLKLSVFLKYKLTKQGVIVFNSALISTLLAGELNETYLPTIKNTPRAYTRIFSSYVY